VLYLVFTNLNSLFYLNKVNFIPEDIYNKLYPIALAQLIKGVKFDKKFCNFMY